MAVQMAELLRNAVLDAIETHIGTDALVKIFTGAKPAGLGDADPAGLLVTITCPTDYMGAAASGAKAKAGTWSALATGAGVAASFRLYTSGSVAKIQGTVGQGSGDLSLDNTTIAVGQTVTIGTFTFTDGNP